MIDFEQKTAYDYEQEIAQRVKARRKEKGLTQAQLAEKAAVSLPSYKRFEQKGLISLHSLLDIAFALDCAPDFDELFSKRGYASLDEVIAERKKQRDGKSSKNGKKG